ncbi:small nuclear ribonucleoprotein [Hibiscus syriacus]|uniref:Small nuclear ribonucleoprotein n=1 Tax=Hibiscus syriacus TaxID=106335 RepID=A0A6A3B1V2_HIBSY|nr:pollen receptor-like kinase 3 [Hibiscus syriacus]KAE8709059.1 small nuclear ribonucleoprotein [Hibiscus syriacus]
MAASCCSLTSFLLLFLLFSPEPTFAASDSQALLMLKESFDDAIALVSWTPGSVPCNEEGPWEGLLCLDGILVGLRLEGMGLSGEIDVDALILLKDLRYFSVLNNSFDGNIPEINRLGALKALYLSMNKFSGEIPPDYFTGMGSLKRVWLSDNEFSGKIPDSLTNVSRLIDLHLENNQFSGEIPDFNQQDLTFVNFSNNKLEGEIPSSLWRFSANIFAENPGLCGAQIRVRCNKTDKPSSVNGGGDKNDRRKIIAATVTLGVMLIALIIFLVFAWRKKKRKKASNGRGNATENGNSIANIEAQVSMPATVGEVHVVRRNPNRHGRCISHPGTSRGGAVPELVVVNHEKGVIGLPSLMKAAAIVLGNGSLGSSYKATMANGVSVVVKRTKEMNSLGKDEFDVGVKRLGKLKHPNVLTPLAYHYRIEEKLFVYEFVENGSLLYRLHGDRGTLVAAFDWLARLKIVQGIIEGLDYIHAELAYLDVPHGNLKSSNVLLGPENRPRVSEYGLCSLVSTDRTGTLMAYNTPEATQHGKVCHKSDVYCLGIIILEILTGKFPSQYLEHGKGGIDVVELAATALSEGKQAEVFDPEIASGSNSLGEMEKLLRIGSLCTKTSPDERLDLKEAITMMQEIRVDTASESGPRATTIEAPSSLQEGHADAKSQVDSSSIREGNV